MATRRDIREAFYAELESAASGLVPAGNITQEYPDSTEDLPSIVHRDAYRDVPMNRGGAAPADVTYNNDGSIDTLLYKKIRQAVFTLVMVDDDEIAKEDIYEAVYTHFDAYTTDAKDESLIHADVNKVETADSNPQDQRDREPIARGDDLTVRLNFTRIYERDVDAIDAVDLAVDAGTTDTGDGIDDITRTIN